MQKKPDTEGYILYNLYEVQEQSKPIYGNDRTVFVCGTEDLTEMGYKGTF